MNLYLITLACAETGDQFNLGQSAEGFMRAAVLLSHADEVLAAAEETGCDGDCPNCDIIH